MPRPRKCKGRCARCRRSRCVATAAEIAALKIPQAATVPHISRRSRPKMRQLAATDNLASLAEILSEISAASMSRRDRRRARFNPWRRGRRVTPSSATVGEIGLTGRPASRESRRQAARGIKVATPPRPASDEDGTSTAATVGDSRAGS